MHKISNFFFKFESLKLFKTDFYQGSERSKNNSSFNFRGYSYARYFCIN